MHLIYSALFTLVVLNKNPVQSKGIVDGKPCLDLKLICKKKNKKKNIHITKMVKNIHQMLASAVVEKLVLQSNNLRDIIQM